VDFVFANFANGATMPSDFESYTVTRLDQLEAQQRRLRRRATWLSVLVVGQGLILLYLLLPVGRIGIPKYVEASYFVLVDGHGRVRGELKMDEGPQLQLLTEKGQERATVWVNHDGSASLILMDNAGVRAVLLYAYDGGVGIQFNDQKGGRSGFIQTDQQPGFSKFDDAAPPPMGPKR
jgi:hypothetical protein